MSNLVDQAAGRARHQNSAPATRVPILMYHQLAAQPRADRRLAVDPKSFADQLGYLHRCGYKTVTTRELAQALRTGDRQLPDKPVVLTFDDGYADFHEVALPLLARYGFTGTVFVTTGWVAGDAGQRRRQQDDMLSWRQIEEVAAAGVEIGAHSVHHPQLDQLGRDRLEHELGAAKGALEDRLGTAVPGLAYPFGYSNRLVRETAAAAGYEYACAVGNRLADSSADPFALPRATIARSTRLASFAQIVAAERLPIEFVGYRTLTLGWSAARCTRSAMRKLAR
jgi:peptidoglycan/xylan/chitin deacetylase (PgdA/CDA1 family)